jgi:beta-fructofuranosidase
VVGDAVGSMFWTPKEHHLGDPTIIRVGEEYHLFTEQSPVGASGRGGLRSVGHAVSRDLFHWEELPIALHCGPAGSFDAWSIYHMDVCVHAGKWFMHYTGLDRFGPGEQQSIGLATSDDGIHWEKHPANPVLRADPRWYEPAVPREATYQEKDFGRLWFRDPCIMRDPETGRFGMIVVARDAGQHPDVRGCLAWATSDDLIHWEAHPPIYSPGRFHTIETPSLFAHGSRHYLLFMTHSDWGPPVMTTDPYQTGGDFYAISESGWTGPYRQPEDEVVVAAYGRTRLGAQRTVEGPDGERYLYGWMRMEPRGDDTPTKPARNTALPPPRRVRFLSDGQMQVVFHEGVEAFCGPAAALPGTPASLEIADPERWRRDEGVVGKNLGSRSVALLPGRCDNVIFSARVDFRRGERAGLVLRAEAGAGAQGWQVVADRRHGRVEFGTLDGNGFIDARRWPVRDEFELKVVAHGPSVEVYGDDRLMIHQIRYRETIGHIGFLVDRAEARFSHARLRTFKDAEK